MVDTEEGATFEKKISIYDFVYEKAGQSAKNPYAILREVFILPGVVRLLSCKTPKFSNDETAKRKWNDISLLIPPAKVATKIAKSEDPSGELRHYILSKAFQPSFISEKGIKTLRNLRAREYDIDYVDSETLRVAGVTAKLVHIGRNGLVYELDDELPEGRVAVYETKGGGLTDLLFSPISDMSGFIPQMLSLQGAELRLKIMDIFNEIYKRKIEKAKKQATNFLELNREVANSFMKFISHSYSDYDYLSGNLSTLPTITGIIDDESFGVYPWLYVNLLNYLKSSYTGFDRFYDMIVPDPVFGVYQFLQPFQTQNYYFPDEILRNFITSSYFLNFNPAVFDDFFGIQLLAGGGESNPTVDDIKKSAGILEILKVINRSPNITKEKKIKFYFDLYKKANGNFTKIPLSDPAMTQDDENLIFNLRLFLSSLMRLKMDQKTATEKIVKLMERNDAKQLQDILIDLARQKKDDELFSIFSKMIGIPFGIKITKANLRSYFEGLFKSNEKTGDTKKDVQQAIKAMQSNKIPYERIDDIALILEGKNKIAGGDYDDMMNEYF